MIDDYFPKFDILKEIFCPHRLYHGKAQVVLVLLDTHTGRWSEVCEQFEKLTRAGCQVIGVPMPGYPITDFHMWWPKNMPSFKDYTLFFDGTWKDEMKEGTWKDEMEKKLMPQIHQFLEEWNDSRAGEGDAVPDGATPASLQAEAEGAAYGPLQDRIYVSKEAMRKSMLPCPSCLKLGYPDPHFFNRDECMLHFASIGAMTNRKGFFPCPKCEKKVKVKDVIKRPIFLSYNWVYRCHILVISRIAAMLLYERTHTHTHSNTSTSFRRDLVWSRTRAHTYAYTHIHRIHTHECL